MSGSPIEVHTIVWNGIRIEVRWRRSWLDFYERLYGHPLALLEIESIDPEDAPLPMTKTGYRAHHSHFDVIEAQGGPVAFVRVWLTEAAKNPEWIAVEAERKQLSLF